MFTETLLNAYDPEISRDLSVESGIVVLAFRTAVGAMDRVKYRIWEKK